MSWLVRSSASMLVLARYFLRESFCMDASLRLASSAPTFFSMKNPVSVRKKALLRGKSARAATLLGDTKVARVWASVSMSTYWSS